jgi:hypothetical protein
MDTSGMVAKLRAVKASFLPDLLEAVRAEYGIELREAQERCPVDVSADAEHPGALKSSAKLTVYSEGGKVKAVLSFGGTNEMWPDVIVTYEVIVHEDLEAHHEVGQAKYLESTLNESAPFMLDRIAARMKW